MLNQILVRIEAEIHPTEDVEKVKSAVRNLFINPSFEVRSLGDHQLLVAYTSGREGLAQVQRLLRETRIRDAARRVLLRGRTDGETVFYLHKQAAYVGRVSLCEPHGESPLGPLVVTMRATDLAELIDWIAPSASMRKGMMETVRDRKGL